MAPKYHRSALLLNTGTGHCLEAGFLAGIAATDWTWSPRFEDLDNDGRLDLFVTNGFPRDPGEDTARRMMKAETPAERIRIMYDSPPQAEVHLAFRNLGDLQLRERQRGVGPRPQGRELRLGLRRPGAGTAISTSSTPTTTAAPPSCATTTTPAIA